MTKTHRLCYGVGKSRIFQWIVKSIAAVLIIFGCISNFWFKSYIIGSLLIILGLIPLSLFILFARPIVQQRPLRFYLPKNGDNPKNIQQTGTEHFSDSQFRRMLNSGATHEELLHLANCAECRIYVCDLADEN